MNGEILAEQDGLRLRIMQDECPPDPRVDFDHLCTMVCFHKCESLGDPHNYQPETALDDVLEENYPGGIWALPLYVMGHSGLSMRVDPSLYKMCDSAGWDWGTVGFIYVSKAAMRKEWPSVRTDLELAHKAEDIMHCEVEEYDQYLRGDVWGWVIERKCTDPECGHWIVEDSCGGYFGYEYACEGAESNFEEWMKQRENREAVANDHRSGVV